MSDVLRELDPKVSAEIKAIGDTILTEQSLLNSLYNPKWLENYSVDCLNFSLAEELVEMNMEISFLWKFFGSLKFDFDKALEEFIDVVHFSATRTLLTTPDSDIDINKARDVTKLYSATPNTHAGMLQVLVDINRILEDDGFYGHAPKFYRLLALGCVLFDFTPSQMLVSYLHKNKKNKARVQNGAATRDIDKSGEQGTYDYLLVNKFVFETKLCYNERLTQFGGKRYL